MSPSRDIIIARRDSGHPSDPSPSARSVCGSCYGEPCHKGVHHTLFRRTLFRQTLFRQSMHSLDVVWLTAVGLRAVPIGKTPNQIPKIRGSTIVLEVRCNFSRGGAPKTHWDTLPRLCFPQSPQCLDQCRSFDASNHHHHDA